MLIKHHLPELSESERSPLVDTLLGLIEQLVEENSRQAETVQQLRDEIAHLKGEKGMPWGIEKVRGNRLTRWRQKALVYGSANFAMAGNHPI